MTLIAACGSALAALRRRVWVGDGEFTTLAVEWIESTDVADERWIARAMVSTHPDQQDAAYAVFECPREWHRESRGWPRQWRCVTTELTSDQRLRWLENLLSCPSTDSYPHVRALLNHALAQLNRRAWS